ncbi:MAG TPA: hypothetical protein VGD05_09715 [Pyrinomonadaceae bacterium]|jgi:hypothetical protein
MSKKHPLCKCPIHVLDIPKADEAKVLMESGTGDIFIQYASHEFRVSRQLQDDEREEGRAKAAAVGE